MGSGHHRLGHRDPLPAQPPVRARRGGGGGRVHGPHASERRPGRRPWFRSARRLPVPDSRLMRVTVVPPARPSNVRAGRRSRRFLVQAAWTPLRGRRSPGRRAEGARPWREQPLVAGTGHDGTSSPPYRCPRHDAPGQECFGSRGNDRWSSCFGWRMAVTSLVLVGLTGILYDGHGFYHGWRTVWTTVHGSAPVARAAPTGQRSTPIPVPQTTDEPPSQVWLTFLASLHLHRDGRPTRSGPDGPPTVGPAGQAGAPRAPDPPSLLVPERGRGSSFWSPVHPRPRNYLRAHIPPSHTSNRPPSARSSASITTPPTPPAGVGPDVRRSSSRASPRLGGASSCLVLFSRGLCGRRRERPGVPGLLLQSNGAGRGAPSDEPGAQSVVARRHRPGGGDPRSRCNRPRAAREHVPPEVREWPT